ncbi:hypothetical protein D3C86_1778620 [compost metagenome]
MLDERQRRRLRGGNDRGLGSAIKRDERLTATAGLARHIDDLATACAGNHDIGDGLHHEKRSLEIDVENPLIALFGNTVDRRHIEDSGIVDKDIDAAEFLIHRLHHRIDLTKVSHIQLYGLGRRADGGGRRRRTGEIDVSDDDLGAFIGKSLCETKADTAGGACN